MMVKRIIFLSLLLATSTIAASADQNNILDSTNGIYRRAKMRKMDKIKWKSHLTSLFFENILSNSINVLKNRKRNNCPFGPKNLVPSPFFDSIQMMVKGITHGAGHVLAIENVAATLRQIQESVCGN